MKRFLIPILVALIIIIVWIFFIIKIAGDYDCSDFASWETANLVFKDSETDIYNLDADHDGIPCESLK